MSQLPKKAVFKKHVNSFYHWETLKLTQKIELSQEACKQVVIGETPIRHSFKRVCASDHKFLLGEDNCIYYTAKTKNLTPSTTQNDIVIKKSYLIDQTTQSCMYLEFFAK